MGRLLLTAISEVAIFVTDIQGWSVTMPGKRQEPPRGPMIHVRLDEKTHHDMKIFAVSSGGIIQSVVSNLIKRRLAEDRKSAEKIRRKEEDA
jgi:hypothetical protein